MTFNFQPTPAQIAAQVDEKHQSNAEREMRSPKNHSAVLSAFRFPHFSSSHRHAHRIAPLADLRVARVCADKEKKTVKKHGRSDGNAAQAKK